MTPPDKIYRIDYEYHVSEWFPMRNHIDDRKEAEDRVASLKEQPEIYRNVILSMYAKVAMALVLVALCLPATATATTFEAGGVIPVMTPPFRASAMFAAEDPAWTSNGAKNSLLSGVFVDDVIGAASQNTIQYDFRILVP